MRCGGLLLTGGRSSRFGQDKATARWGDTTLARRAAAALAAVADPCVEAGPGASGLVSVDDPRQGPLAAVAAALPHLPAGIPVVVLACDLPLVDPPLLRLLADHPAPGSVVPLSGEPAIPQPLVARWSPVALARVAGLVASGERSFRRLVEEPEVTFFSPTDPSVLDDADTPAELERLRRRAAQTPS